MLELTPTGRAVLTSRQPVMLTKPAVALETKARRAGELSCDETLFDRLRSLRKRLADERDVPAYIVFSDVALRQMARDYPSSEREFGRISGVGERKLREFGTVFLTEIASYLQDNPKQIFAGESFAAPAAPKPRLNDTARVTLQAFRVGKSVSEIASARGLTAGTIYGHLAAALEAGEQIELGRLLTPEQERQIAAAFAQSGLANLSGTKELLGDAIDYGLLRLYRAAKSGSG